MIEEDVGGFEVAVDDAVLVGVIEGVGEDVDECGDIARRHEIAGGVEAIGEGTAGGDAGGEEGLAVVIAAVVEREDVRVLEGGEGLGFDEEAGAGVLAEVAREEHFEGDLAVWGELGGAVDDAHAAAAEFADDAVAGDALF